MNWRGIELICPGCRGELEQPGEREIVCRECQKRYRVTLGIPDLRVAPDPYIGFEAEYEKVEKLVSAYHEHTFEGFIDFYYRNTSVVPPQHAAMYKRGLMAAEARARGWLALWEEAAGTSMQMHLGTRGLLEVGCGTGPLLAVADRYRPRIGVDIALRWLVVGKKRLEERGVDVPLICASAEALPFPPGRFDTLVMDSALEHFSVQDRALDQALRALAPGGWLFVSTPNRFSIGPDPHTGILAGSLLPESWTAALVKRQGGIPPKRRLLSEGQLRYALEHAGFTEVQTYVPGIPAEQRAHFGSALRAAIGMYEVARVLPVSRVVLRRIGPLLHAVGRRRPELKKEEAPSPKRAREAPKKTLLGG